MVYLITGGTGTLGKALVKHLLEKQRSEITKIIIFSRDEQKQFQMALDYPENEYPELRFFIGDVRDQSRIRMALKGVDYVIHAAAMKHVPISEYNPMECIKTNIGGAQNIIEASIDAGVKKVVALSTDKACAPINLYGATKLASDKLFVAANNIKGVNPINFSVVRYGNVMGSNGSVIPFFQSRKSTGKLPITDPSMTRFNISIEEGVEMVLHALKYSEGGEIFVPKIPSYNIIDLANAICDKCDKPVVGIRPGEKLHEEMISTADSFYTYDLGKYYVILPPNYNLGMQEFIKRFNAIKVENGFSYNSGTNSDWETIETLKQKIKNLN
jgi:UDP-N-acetylglucosamine 4,6-dehydratase (inverting)